MKKIIFLLLTTVFISLASFAQNYTVTVHGSVMIVVDNSVSPVPNQAVIITIDSSASGYTYQNTVYTNESGYYEDVIALPGYSGTEFVHTMTYDSCLGYYLYNFQPIIPGVELQPMDFYLCNNAPPDCQASFYYYQSDPTDPNTFTFQNSSYGSYTEVLWSFGDSTTSTEMNPIHTFPGPGTYYVCLTITGPDCSSTYCEYVYTGGGGNGCENYFYYTYNEPYTLTFEGFLMNGQQAQYYSWDFGDGTYGTGQTITHSYSPQGVGMYLVGLTTFTTSPNGGDSCMFTSYQEVWIQNQTEECESFILPLNMYGLTVDFEGYTVSPYETNYTWEFGDGVTGTGQFISHTFPSAGMYNVVLQTADATGCYFETFTQIWLDSTNQGGCSAWFTYYPQDENNFTFSGYIALNNGQTYPDSSAVYSWDFGDGTTGTGQTITHYFQDNPAGYMICLTATTVLPDGSTCTGSYCENISMEVPAFNIFGYVYLENNLAADQAVVHLMSMDSTWQGVIEVQSTVIDSGGFYSFADLPLYYDRLYFVQAELTEGSAYFGDYLPTYHFNSLTWEQANPILPLNNWTADVFMIPGSPVEGGNGMITGVVSNLGARSFMNDVEVVLMDTEKNPLIYSRSDEQGNFTFKNLALGTYVLHAEIMGVHTVQAEVTLSEQDPSASVEVQVSGDEANVVFGIADHSINLETVSEIYPNPVTGSAKIDITAKKESGIELSIVSLTGQMVSKEAYVLDEGTQTINLEFGSIPEGIYLVRILSAQGDMMNRRIVIIR